MTDDTLDETNSARGRLKEEHVIIDGNIFIGDDFHFGAAYEIGYQDGLNGEYPRAERYGHPRNQDGYRMGYLDGSGQEKIDLADIEPF